MKEVSFNEFCGLISTTKKNAVRMLFKNRDSSYHKAWDLNGKIINHHLTFCAVASSNIHIRSIFEIGTGAGNCARLLANIFPESLIKTLDILENRDNGYATKLLTPFKNVEMLEYNSTFLWKNEKEIHDCIFVDGCHKHPVVFSDMLWAYFNVGKIVLFHDVGPGEPHVGESLKYLDSIVDEEILIIKSGVNPRTMSYTGVLIKK